MIRPFLAIQRLLRHAVLFEGSTRPIGLIRIGLPMLAWARYGAVHRFLDASDLPTAILAGAFWTSSIAMLVGFYSRASTALLGATLFAFYYYIGFALDQESYTHHHTYTLMAAVILLAMSPCGRSLSVDRWLALRREAAGGPKAPPERGPLWAQLLIGVQASCIYFWGAYDKTNMPWFLGARMEHYSMRFYLGSDYPQIPGFKTLMAIMGTSTVLLEYALAVGLWVRRWQRVLIPAGLLLHLGMYVFLPVATFSATMALLYLSYLDPDMVHRLISRVVPSTEDAG